MVRGEEVLPKLVVNPCFTLAWDVSTTPGVEGYRIHRGVASRVYDTVYDVGNVTSYKPPCLPDGKIYYFAATAYSGSLESDYSNEVAIVWLAPPNLRVVDSAYGRVGWDAMFSASKYVLRWGTSPSTFGSYKNFTIPQDVYRIAQSPKNRTVYAVVDAVTPNRSVRSNTISFIRRY